MRMMLLLPSRRTASPLMPKLLSQSLVYPADCLIQRRSSLRNRLYGVGHGSSSHYRHLKRFYSHDGALAASGEGPVAGRHDLAEAVPRGLHARMIKAREAEKLRLAREKSAAAEAILKKAIAARRERDQAKKQLPPLDWYHLARTNANARRTILEAVGDEVGLEWEDVFDASLLQLTTLLAAQRAAKDAEEAMQRADAADSASVEEARRLEDNATRLAELAAQQAGIYEELRAKARAREEAHPAYLHDPDKATHTAHIFSRCRICMMPHPPSVCPYLFDDPQDRVLGVSPYLVENMSAMFRKRWDADAKFREAILYLRSKFSRAPGSTEALPSFQRHTLDAPPSAIRELSISTVVHGQENTRRRLAFPVAILADTTAHSNPPGV